MNDSGGKSQKKSKDKILKILYVLAAATEAPSFGMDLFELKKKKKKKHRRNWSTLRELNVSHFRWGLV